MVSSLDLKKRHRNPEIVEIVAEIEKAWNFSIWTSGPDAIGTGVFAGKIFPANGCFTRWQIFADQVTNSTFDLYVIDYDNYPPGAEDSICGANKPAITAAIKGQDDVAVDWTPEFNFGDILWVNLDVNSAATELNLVLYYIGRS